MLKLTNELRLSALTSDVRFVALCARPRSHAAARTQLEARNHHADNMDSINRRAETRDRDRVKRIRVLLLPLRLD
jgi:hypothetical protein